MPNERSAERKPLSFSTTMRNPARIANFLECVLPYEDYILTDDVIHNVSITLIKKKIYIPSYVNKTPRLKAIITEEREFTNEEAEEIMQNSPQDHKEKGFSKGWPSRFDTWYKPAMEFGFLYYEMNTPIIISTSGHMLIDAQNEFPVNEEKIQNVFLNALMKYQTNNPFRKNLNENVPLVLLIQVIKLLKDDPEENDAGIFRSELSLLICWPNNDAHALYRKIKELRHQYHFSYGDEIIYEMCLEILGATEADKKRFKLKQIISEGVDDFIRKMRITGIISLRGNGRFLDLNSFESERIEYILNNYSSYNTYVNKQDYFNYISAVDTNVISITNPINEEEITDIKTRTLNKWAENYSKQDIANELKITCCGRQESQNEVLRLIAKPTRLEFLTSIALRQNFTDIEIHPNYHIDDEGLPTCAASGGIADIECYDVDCNSLVEVTLMCARNQATNEIPAIKRHLQEAVEQHPDITTFSMLVAPSIHTDSEFMADFTKFQYNLDIITLTINEFIDKISEKDRIIEMLSA